LRFHNNYDSTLAISYCDIANFGDDLNLDCTIDLLDFGIMMSSWLDYVGPE
jgi:hypothetical protein